MACKSSPRNHSLFASAPLFFVSFIAHNSSTWTAAGVGTSSTKKKHAKTKQSYSCSKPWRTTYFPWDTHREKVIVIPLYNRKAISLSPDLMRWSVSMPWIRGLVLQRLLTALTQKTANTIPLSYVTAIIHTKGKTNVIASHEKWSYCHAWG
jgi:hypothetical protein